MATRSTTNIPRHLQAPVKGLNAVSSIMNMPPDSALVLENWIPYPDALQTRPGQANHVTGFGANVARLFTYSSNAGVEKLFATTSGGVYDATTAGVVGAAAIALTEGKCIATTIATGANNYLMIVNGVDSLVRFDGAAWASVAVLGAQATNVYSYVETYRQRLFFVRKNTLTIDYLATNSIAGAPTSYDLGAVFRLGGKLVALGTWTIDGGSGAEDQLVAVTSQGELAIFAGSDPSAAATWALRGVFYIGKPLGPQCLSKYGGDLLYLCEAGLFPVSKALLAASIDRTQSITEAVRPVISSFAKTYAATDGWQICVQPNIPLLILNIPSAPLKKQLCMYIPTGAWCTFAGIEATNFALYSGDLFAAVGTKVVKLTGASDFGANIVATSLGAYQQWGTARGKRAVLVKNYFQPSASFSYGCSLARDFAVNPIAEAVATNASLSASLWGTATFGTSYWSSSASVLQDWLSISDTSSLWKAVYLQVSSKNAAVRYLGADFRFVYGSGMGY